MLTALPDIPRISGVYLWTFEYEEGYFVYGAGITKRPVGTRLREHTRAYLDGRYTILDVAALRGGKRKENWHGLWAGARSEERLATFGARRSELNGLARRQLETCRVFVAIIDQDERLRERVEAAIMGQLYSLPAPFCDIPDRGMALRPRRESEDVVSLISACEHLLHGIPGEMSI